MMRLSSAATALCIFNRWRSPPHFHVLRNRYQWSGGPCNKAVAHDAQIEQAYRSNTPQTVSNWLHTHRGKILPDFPFGTDFNEIERVLLPALSSLANSAPSKRRMLGLLRASFTASPHPREHEAMERMGYAAAPRLTDPLQSRALRGALRSV
jgi:hypothetical protein